MTARCTKCHYRHADAKGWSRSWLCTRFPNDGVDPVSGEPEPPYKFCWEVLRISTVQRLGPCEFFEAQKEGPPMVVHEGFKGKSATRATSG